MKRILLPSLCLMLLMCAAQAEGNTYYVNPDGGQFYHAESQCSLMNEKYWERQITVSASELSQEPYNELMACPSCISPSTETERLDPWISRYDTAQDVRIDAPGIYRVGADLSSGLYTVVTDDQCNGALITSLSSGMTLNEFAIHGAASYSIYLYADMCVTLPEHAVLTPLIKQNGADAQAETIRQARRMMYYEMQPGVYTASAIEGEDAYIAFSSIDAEIGGKPTVFPLPAGETLTFDTVIDGFNDPMPRNYFAFPEKQAYFVEFINCVVTPVNMNNP
ncbi:MAG: hypothetical protein J1E43_03625 [Christensenellaceae bacterium]|nr:hypothetical protein [Christensenellaceae bacterium]